MKDILMRIFIDTSSLVKRYIVEQGSEELIKVFSSVEEVIIAPRNLLHLIKDFLKLQKTA
ncbi:MAG: hypothetical protein HW421_1809 [Ignavibacteria bacterium]|nr:hypothetical protein [Ignavibacteria bacterium]